MFTLAPRLQLQTLLETILGSRNVYYQQPASDQMKYPCIVYKRDDEDTTFANNSPYNHKQRYLVTIIDRNPDSTIRDTVKKLPTARFSRTYIANNLNHDAYTLYF